MKKNLIQVEGSNDYRRDPTTGAILNVNRSRIEMERAAADKKKKEREEIDTLKQDVNEIKLMLSKIAEKLQ